MGGGDTQSDVKMEKNMHSKIGKITSGFGTFQLKSVLVKNDAGDWGSEPNKNAVGIIRSTNFNNNGVLDLSDIAYRTLSPLKIKDKKLSLSDILVERSGGSDTQPVGRVGFITEEIAAKGYSFANFIQRISLDNTVDAKYVYYCLQQMYEMGITASMQFQTTGIRNLDWKYYIRTILPKPNKSEQTAIANILSKVDEAIATVESSIAAVERLKKSLMQNLLTGKMKPDGTFRTPDEFYTDPKFGKVPVGWEIKKLKEVCINNGEYGANASAIPYNGASPRYIRITDIDDYGQLLEDDKATIDLKDYNKYLLQDGDFLFARTGDTVGKSLLYKKEQMGLAVYAGYLIKYSFDKEKLIPEYFNLVAKSVFFEQFKVAMKRVGAKPNINSREYASFKILLPKDTKEQQQILSQFDNIDDIVKRNTNKVRILERLKKALMQNLLTGKIRINN